MKCNDFYGMFEDWIDSYLKEEDSEIETVEGIFTCEANRNNCDLDNQIIFTENEISSLLEDTIEWLKSQDDRCNGCGNIILDKDLLMSSQSHAYGDDYATENYASSHKCSYCGEEEEY